MRYFLDTEFIEQGSDRPIDLISIGIVSEDDRTYYAVNNKFDPRAASEWVLENVLLPMGIGKNGWIALPGEGGLSPRQMRHWLARKNRVQIAKELLEFFDPNKYGRPEIWAYYQGFDYAVFSQIFGTMNDYPGIFPMYFMDLNQWAISLGNPELPEQLTAQHDALEDARWNKKVWEFLREYEQDCVVERQ